MGEASRSYGGNSLLEEGGVIYANTTGQGRGGTINVKAEEIHATGGYIYAQRLWSG